MKKTFGRRAVRPEMRKISGALRTLLELFIENMRETEKTVYAIGREDKALLSRKEKQFLGEKAPFFVQDRKERIKEASLDEGKKEEGIRSVRQARAIKKNEKTREDESPDGSNALCPAEQVKKKKDEIVRAILPLIEGGSVTGSILSDNQYSPAFAKEREKARLIEEIRAVLSRGEDALYP